MTTFETSTFDGIKASEMLSDVILEGLIVQVKLQDSVQVQTVLALYDRETIRNNGQIGYLRLKTSVKTSYESDDENSKLQSSKRSCGKRSNRKESGRVFSVDGPWTMFKGRLTLFQP